MSQPVMDIETKLREQGDIEERLRLPVSESMFVRRSDMLRALFAERAEAADTIASLRKQVSDVVGAWREITEDDRPPNDVEVLMGCWESWPRTQWVVEYGLYGSTKGGWTHGRMTHWLPSSILPEPPLASLKGEADA